MELQIKYEEGNITLQGITDLQQATVEREAALATTDVTEIATRKSQRERKRKKLPGESDDDEVVKEPEQTTSKGKVKKLNKMCERMLIHLINYLLKDGVASATKRP